MDSHGLSSRTEPAGVGPQGGVEAHELGASYDCCSAWWNRLLLPVVNRRPRLQVTSTSTSKDVQVLRVIAAGLDAGVSFVS